ncbi:MAG TPA: carboxypeptidase-like regulatory domain-containing protein [Candidatus Thermoplasmatota archaeon]|nr:carboxypeptidase-like regulatory domain-containing protein [Candidatus Thermoplasmatota archaeon]
MRPLLALALLALAALAGCAGGGNADKVPSSADDFDDKGVTASATTGVLLGIVVDEAIRPIPVATVVVSGAGEATGTTDELGRFAFGSLQPGTYFLKASAPQFTSSQSSAEVVAGDADPPVVRVQLTRLFTQAPYAETIKFDGYIACAYAVGVSSTCANDYTRLLAGTVPGCEGGCLKQYNVSQQAGNIREFRTDLGPGWTAIVMEEYWEPSVGPPASKGTMGFILSYFNRTSTGHWWLQGSGPSPLRVQLDVGEHGPGEQGVDDLIPPEGMRDLFVIFGAGDEDVAVNQKFQFFQVNFYYVIPPEGWSFVNGDPMPF